MSLTVVPTYKKIWLLYDERIFKDQVPITFGTEIITYDM